MLADNPLTNGAEKELRLACSDMERRLRAGERCRSEEVLAAHPEWRQDANSALELIYAEFTVRLELEGRHDPSEWYERFPEWHDRLERLFRVHEMLCAGGPSETARTGSTPFPLGGGTTHHDDSGVQRVGPYEILEEIERGGMGVVYKARHVALNRLAAVKMIRAGALAGADERARFRREAEAAARLQHPNIVPIYDVGEHGGRPYLAMEFVEGGSLDARLAGTPLAPRCAAALTETLARAMQYAHEQGIIHRDLKPANILLQGLGIRESELGIRSSSAGDRRPRDLQSPPGNSESLTANPESLIPKITDFGLAKLLEAEPGQTATGEVLGTPSYMAPEQAGGQSRQIGPAVDVYALGAILYEMLTGRPPHCGETPLQTLEQTRAQEPVAPSRLQPRVPRDLETVCLKCLQKEPRRRYFSAAALAEDLRRFLAGEPIRARAVGAGERLWRWCRRKPVVASLAAALLLALIGGLAGVTWAWQRALQKEAEARHERELADKSLRQGVDAVDEFLTYVSQNRLLNQPGLHALRKELLEAALKYYRQFLEQRGDDRALRKEVAWAHFHVAQITETIGSKETALAEYEQARDAWLELSEEEPANGAHQTALAHALLGLGKLQGETGRDADALRSLLQARKLSEQLTSANPASVEARRILASALNCLGDVKRQMGDGREAQDSFQLACGIHERLCEEYPSDTDVRRGLAMTLNSLSNVQRAAGRLDEAQRGYERVVQLYQQTLDAEPTDDESQCNLATSWMNLGLVHLDRRDTAKARQAFEQASGRLEPLVRANPGVHRYLSTLAMVHLNRAAAAIEVQQWPEALSFTQKSRELTARLVKMNPTDTTFQNLLAKNWANLAYIQQRSGGTGDPRYGYREAVAIWETLARKHPADAEYRRECAFAANTLGTLEYNALNTEEAIHWHQRARVLLSELLRERPDDFFCRSELGANWNNEGMALHRLGRHADAVAAYRQAIAEQRMALEHAPQSERYRRYLSNHHSNLARLLRELGQPEAAAATCAEWAELWPRNGAQLYAAARQLALLATSVSNRERSSTGAEPAARERYAQQACALLKRALANGFSDRDQLKKDSAWNILRSHDEFQRLLTSEGEKAKPP